MTSFIKTQKKKKMRHGASKVTSLSRRGIAHALNFLDGHELHCSVPSLLTAPFAVFMGPVRLITTGPHPQAVTQRRSITLEAIQEE